MNLGKKGISPVVSVVLLLVVGVSAVVVLQNWYSSYSSSLYTEAETVSGDEGLGTRVESVVNNELYFRNGYDNLSINDVEVDGTSCSISGSYVDGIKNFNLSSCSENVSGIKDVVVYTDKGVYSQSVFFEGASSSSSNSSGSNPSYPEGAFVTQWNTSASGDTSSTEIRLPLQDTGTYNFNVSWGDGTNDTITSWDQAEKTHDYGSEGVYNVTVTGTLEGFGFGKGRTYDSGCFCFLLNDDAPKLSDIMQWGDVKLHNQGKQFYYAENLKISATDTPDLSGITDMGKMFAQSNFNSNINAWNVSSVQNMSYMFFNTQFFNQPLNNWDVSSVTNMASMFSSASSFNQPLNNWDVSSVTNTARMFSSASSFNQSLIDWNVSSVTAMNNMFSSTPFNQPLNDWDTSNVINMESLFDSAQSFNQPLNNWDVSSVQDMRRMFYSASSFNQSLNNWTTSSVTDMGGMLFYASSFNQPLNNWNVSLVTNMDNMFWAADAFYQNISSWCVEQIGSEPTNFDLNSAFENQASLQPNWGVSC